MKFLLDEHIDPVLAELLEDEGYSVNQVRKSSEGISDKEVVEIAQKHNSIIVTRDDDFLKLKTRFEQMPCIIKINGFPKPSQLKADILKEISNIQKENLENTVLYI